MRRNSILAWRDFDLTGRARVVCNVLEKADRPLTDREICTAKDQTDMNYARPVVTMLVQRGVLRETGNVKCSETGRTVRRVFFNQKDAAPLKIAKVKLMQREGFWKDGEDSRLPMPMTSDNTWFGRKRFINRLLAVETNARVKRYKGSSRCRCCGEENGSAEYRVGAWVWPEGFLHYVVKHNVRPSLAFQEFILREVLR